MVTDDDWRYPSVSRQEHIVLTKWTIGKGFFSLVQLYSTLKFFGGGQ